MLKKLVSNKKKIERLLEKSNKPIIYLFAAARTFRPFRAVAAALNRLLTTIRV